MEKTKEEIISDLLNNHIFKDYLTERMKDEITKGIIQAHSAGFEAFRNKVEEGVKGFKVDQGDHCTMYESTGIGTDRSLWFGTWLEIDGQFECITDVEQE